MIIRNVYEEVGFKRTKKGKCCICGKQCSLTEYFYQTLNPFNKNKDGSLKNRSTINEEEKIKADKWILDPVKHRKCE